VGDLGEIVGDGLDALAQALVVGGQEAEGRGEQGRGVERLRVVGTFIPNGPSRNMPAWRSSSVPNTLGESKRGTQSQSIEPSGATSALVWQSERNA
jgi:hypothetical protein